VRDDRSIARRRRTTADRRACSRGRHPRNRERDATL
jgi:hypothetical protein